MSLLKDATSRAKQAAEAVATPFHLGGWLASDGIQLPRPPHGWS